LLSSRTVVGVEVAAAGREPIAAAPATPATLIRGQVDGPTRRNTLRPLALRQEGLIDLQPFRLTRWPRHRHRQRPV